jgi:hypothetical protein
MTIKRRIVRRAEAGVRHDRRPDRRPPGSRLKGCSGVRRSDVTNDVRLRSVLEQAFPGVLHRGGRQDTYE